MHLIDLESLAAERNTNCEKNSLLSLQFIDTIFMFCVFWTFIERETRVFLPTIFTIYVRWLHIHRRRVCPNLFRILHNFFDCLWRRQEPREEPGRRKPGHDLWHFTEYFSIFTVHLANCRPFQPPACMQTNFYKSLGFWELFVIIVFAFSFFFFL